MTRRHRGALVAGAMLAVGSALPPVLAIADQRLSYHMLLEMALLALVAATGSLIEFAGIDPLLGGALLLFGSLTLLVASVCRSARAGVS